MTVKRLVFLQLVLLAGLGSAYFVPNHGKVQPMGVVMDLPDSIGQWYGVAQKPSKAELETLAADTSFARRVYTNAFGDSVMASIVLAGEDPDNSLHRPERCLPAQGWTILDSHVVTIRDPALPRGSLKVTRLHNQQKVEDDKGNVHAIYNLNYYWFVGHTHQTPSAIDRAVVDIRDRLVMGYNQRWAYVTVTSTVTGNLTKFGRSEAETDEMIQVFIRQLYPRIIEPATAQAIAAAR